MSKCETLREDIGRVRPQDELSAEELETYRLHRRFDRLGRLIGDRRMKKLIDSHVLIVGVGGVGSWAAEAIARSGVGTISLCDFDEVCITNSNRQLHALAGTVGKQKAEIMAERLSKVNPQAQIISHVMFYNEDTNAQIFARRPDYVIDAIDNVTAKCHLLKYCRDHGIPIITSTGSAGRMDPTQVQVRDLSETEVDPLARSLRKILRQKYDFPEAGPFGIKSVFSCEPAVDPIDLTYDNGKGFMCVCPQGENNLHSCDKRSLIWGSAGFVTSTFGMVCASVVVRDLIATVSQTDNATATADSTSPVQYERREITT